MIISLLLFIPETVFALLFIKAGWPESTKKGFFFKMCASAIFVLNGFIGYNFNISAYGKTVLFALIAGFIGDIFLTMDPFLTTEKAKKLSMVFIVTGGIAFLTGHILYFAAYIGKLETFTAQSVKILVSGILILLILAVAVKFILKLSFEKLTAPILLYTLVISSLFSLGLCLAFTVLTGKPAAQITICIAPLLFIISDSSLVMKFFEKERFNTLSVRAVNLGTYFAAQMLFGLSIFLING